MNEEKKNSNLELEKIKKELHTRKLELEQEMADIAQEKFSDDQVQDPGDQALTSTMESVRSSFQDSRLGEYKRILKALAMAEDGTYGICVDCGLAISEKRLKSYPDATRCLSCQEAFEEGR